MRRSDRSSFSRRGRLVWLSLAIISLLVSAAHPGLMLRPAFAQDDGTPVSTNPQGEIATQEPVESVPATALVSFRVADADDQLIADGYRLCVDGVTCVDILDGWASVGDLAAGTHTYEVSWKWDGEGPFQHKIDTFWVDPSIGENQVRIELTATPVFAPAVEPSATDDPATIPVSTATDAPSPTATEVVPTATDASSPTATDAATATSTSTATATPSVTTTTTLTATASVTATATASATATTTASATATATKTTVPTSTSTPTITPTLAPTSGKVTGTGGAGVNCRAQPSTSGAVIAVLREGDTVTYRGAAANGWQPVTCAGKAGYISATYLAGIPVTPTATPRPSGTPTRTVTITTTATGTPTRTPTVTGTITTTTTVTGTATVTKTATVTPTSSPTGTPVAGGKVQGTGGAGVNCRRTASTSGTIITTVPEGTVLAYRGPASNGWQPVTCAGQAGFISTAYLAGVTITPTPVRTPGASPTPTATTTPPSGTSGVITGTGGGGLNCRTQPSTTAPVITIIPEGSIVQFRGTASNGWQPVTCSGQAGFISTAYLTGISAATGELWVDVNLSTQYMIVYRGNTRVLGTYVSTGRPGFDTPTGTFRVWTKLRSQTMSGVIGGEYYNVPDVPWVMYFTQEGHALHGAYWHNNFGHTMSHGCVNLPLDVAAWLYAQAPIGMRVVIHY